MKKNKQPILPNVEINMQYQSGKDVTKSEQQCIEAFSSFKMYAVNQAIFQPSAKNITGTTILKDLHGFRLDLVHRQGDIGHYSLIQNNIQGNAAIACIHINDIKNHDKKMALAIKLIHFDISKRKKIFRYFQREQNEDQSRWMTKCYHFSV